MKRIRSTIVRNRVPLKRASRTRVKARPITLIKRSRVEKVIHQMCTTNDAYRYRWLSTGDHELRQSKNFNVK